MCRRRSSGHTSSGPWSTPATTMWSMFGPGRSGSRRLKSPASTRLAGRGHRVDQLVRALELGAWHLRVPELVRGVDVPDHDPLEPDRVADPPLAPSLADPDRAVLERDERRREQDRVRLAGDAGAKPRRVAALEDAAEPARHERPLRDRLHGGHPAPLLEPARAPRAAAPAGRARPAGPAGQLDHLAEMRPVAPAARCGRGRGSSCGRARAGTSLRSRARRRRRSHPPSRRRTTTRSPPRWRAPGPTSSSSPRAFASAPSRRRTATGAASSSIRSRLGSSAARGCAAAEGAGASARAGAPGRDLGRRRPRPVARAPGSRLVLLRHRAPLVLTAHDLLPRRTAAKTGLWRRAFGRFERIVVHSERGRETLAAFGVPEEKLRVIPHPVTPSDPARADDGRTVLALGLVRPYKQLEHAREAARAGRRRAAGRRRRERVPLGDGDRPRSASRPSPSSRTAPSSTRAAPCCGRSAPACPRSSTTSAASPSRCGRSGPAVWSLRTTSRRSRPRFAS